MRFSASSQEMRLNSLLPGARYIGYFTRVGAWEDSMATNQRSAAVAGKGGEPGEAYHASDYTVYAALQLARDAEAKRTMEEAVKVMGFNPATTSGSRATIAAEQRAAVGGIVHEVAIGSAARKRLDSERAGSGEKVDDSRPFQGKRKAEILMGDDVEDRLAHLVGGRPDP